MNYVRILLQVLLVAWVFSSCSPVRDLGEGQYLLNKNIIKNNKPELNKGIESIFKQKPNRKILGLFRFHLGVYSLANRGRDTRFKRWVKKTIGEAPIVLDSVLTAKSRTQALQYVQNNGYFNATVSDSTDYRKRKKANVIYTVNTGQGYTIKNITYLITDKVVESMVIQDTANSLLKTGNNYNTSNFQAERERVTKFLRNMGYYEFNQLYISFDVDTALKSHQANVKFIIAGTNVPGAGGDSVQSGSHKLYRINNIYIQTDYDPLAKVIKIPTDTVKYKDYYFLSSFKRLQYKPEALLTRVFIEKGDFYKINNGDYTYRGLSALSLFKFINVQYKPIENDTLFGYWLDSHILLTPSAKQDYKLELEGTHNGGNFGIGGSVTYRNRNSFRAAESIEVKFSAKVESIPDFVDTTADASSALSLNTYEIGPLITIRIPRFLWPLQKFNHIRSSNPVTQFSGSYINQKRPEYNRHQFVLSSGFEFKETKYKKHFVYPAEVNFSNFDLTPAFMRKLFEIDDPQLILYYRNYLITNGRYTFLYNTQELNSFRNFIYFRFSFEIAGNSLRLIDKFTKTNYNTEDKYEALGILYSQYIRPDFDLRFYQLFSSHSSMVYRLYAGMGYAYLNSTFIPYEKTFFAGGANDLRAFRPRTVGPGSFQTENFIEQLGDIKINANLEYRFDVFKILKGAVFLDAGNVWIGKATNTFEGGQFEFSTFLDELALGSGLGVRFDFTFFIFRVDAGVPLKDPGRDERDRWVVPDLKPSSILYNFAIGYPF